MEAPPPAGDAEPTEPPSPPRSPHQEPHGYYGPPAPKKTVKDAVTGAGIVALATVVIGRLVEDFWRGFLPLGLFGTALSVLLTTQKLRGVSVEAPAEQSVFGPLAKLPTPVIPTLVVLELSLGGLAIVLCLCLYAEVSVARAIALPALVLTALMLGAIHVYALALVKGPNALTSWALADKFVMAVVILGLGLVASTGWVVGARYVKWPLPSDLYEILPWGSAGTDLSFPRNRGASSKPPPPPTNEGETHTVPPIPSPSESPTEDCVNETYERLHSPPNPRVGDLLWDAWDDYWKDLIGCAVVDPIEVADGVWLAVLTGGTASTPAWLLSDDQGHAAVIFEEVVPQVRRFIKRGTLRYAGDRTKTGYGDYQVLYLVAGRCTLVGRGRFGLPYLRLPPAATRVAMEAAARRNRFPSVESVKVSGNQRVFTIRFEGGYGQDQTAKIIVARSGDAWLANSPRDKWDAASVCGDDKNLEDLAGQLRARVLEELSS